MRDRDVWIGRRDAGRAYLAGATDALALASTATGGSPIAQSAILSAIAYADALTIKVAGIRNVTNHAQLPSTLRHAMGDVLPQAQITQLKKLLAKKDDSAYGYRMLNLTEARTAVEHATRFAAWAETELLRG